MQSFFQHNLPWLTADLERIGRILLILALAVLALRSVRRLIPRLHAAILARQPDQDYSRRFMTLSQVVHYSLTVVVMVVSAVLVLSELGISVAPLLGAAGVVGIAIGFGAQSLVKDYFTGFFLLLENQIRIGDVVEAGGKSGLVEEMTLRYLKLRDYAGNAHYVPNGIVTVVTNMSLGFGCAVIDARIAYGEDVDRALAVMRAIGRELRKDPAFADKILDDLEIGGVENWGESAVILRGRFKTAPIEQWGVRREYLKRLKEAFGREGIEIPVPYVRLVGEKAAG